MKKYSIFNITQAIVNIHFFLSVVSIFFIIILSLLKKTEIPQKDGKLLNLQGKYVSIKADWDIAKDYKYKNGDKISPTYYLEKNKEAGLLHIKADDKIAIFIIIHNLLTFALYIIIAYLLKEIFNSINPNKSFYIENANRIRNIGLCLLIGGVLNLLHGYFLSGYVNQIIKDFGFMKFQTINIIFYYQNSFFMGFLVLALSQVYKRGVELQEENELTV